MLRLRPREFGFTRFQLANNAEPEMVVTKDLCAFPFEKEGNINKGLSCGNELISINKGLTLVQYLSRKKVRVYQTWKVIMVLR